MDGRSGLFVGTAASATISGGNGLDAGLYLYGIRGVEPADGGTIVPSHDLWPLPQSTQQP